MQYLKVRSLLFTLSFLPLFVLGQVWQQNNMEYGFQYKGIKTSRALLIPIIQTTAAQGRDTGAIYYKLSDSSIYVYTGSQWRQVTGSGGGSVSSVFGRTGAVTALEADYNAFYPLLSGTYNNPTWLNQLAWSKITGTPTTLSGYGITTPVAITDGGTGQTTSNAALNALLPSQTGNNGKYLKTDGNNSSWQNVSVSVDSGTLANRPGSPSFGQLYYQTNERVGFYKYNGTEWRQDEPNYIWNYSFPVKAFNTTTGAVIEIGNGGASNHFGSDTILTMSSAFALSVTNSFASYAQIRIGGGQALADYTLDGRKVVYRTKIYLPYLSNATDDFTIRIGSSAGNYINTDGQGFFFKYNHGTNSGNWQCLTINGGGTTTVNTSSAVASRTVYDLVITRYSNSKIEFFVNGTLVAQSTTNIPLKLTTIGAGIYRNAGGASTMNMYIDRLTIYDF